LPLLHNFLKFTWFVFLDFHQLNSLKDFNLSDVILDLLFLTFSIMLNQYYKFFILVFCCLSRDFALASQFSQVYWTCFS
jgi:hypothetical protein